jgi:hypothetical protein
MIGLIMTNKNNMKLGREDKADLGCAMIRESVKDLGHGFSFFKRLLQPEIYLLEQFMRYRTEKKELALIATKYFSDIFAKLEEEQLLRKKRPFGLGREQRLRPSDRKTAMDEISTTKTIRTTKRTGNNSLMVDPRNNSNLECSSRNSRQAGDNILTKMIIGHI